LCIVGTGRDLGLREEAHMKHHHHIAVFTQLGNGHVYPVLPLCTELRKRGHRVTCASNEHYKQIISEAGAEPVLFDYRLMQKEVKEQMKIGLALPFSDSRFKAMHQSWRSHFFEETMQLLPQMKKFFSKNIPDLVLYDRYSVPGRILAKCFDIPAVQMSAHFADFNNLAARINGICQNPDFVVEWSKDLDSFLSKFGFESQGSAWHIEDLNIHFIPREFQHNSDYFDERFCFTGALLGRPFHPVWTKCVSKKPVVLISGMSLWSNTKIDYSAYFGMFIDALSDSPYHCILSIGDDEFSRDVPQNFEINRRASHLEILPHASLSICHGGMTSTLEAIYNGVPPLIVPMSQACEEIAYRAEELGIGIQLAKNGLSAELIRSAVDEILMNSSLRRRVGEMQGIFRSSGGVELAANRIEARI
jgi:MGT family glycosyltransferase